MALILRVLLAALCATTAAALLGASHQPARRRSAPTVATRAATLPTADGGSTLDGASALTARLAAPGSRIDAVQRDRLIFEQVVMEARELRDSPLLGGSIATQLLSAASLSAVLAEILAGRLARKDGGAFLPQRALAREIEATLARDARPGYAQFVHTGLRHVLTTHTTHDHGPVRA